MSPRARLRLGEESGVVLIVVVCIIAVLGMLAAAILSTSVAGKRESASTRYAKQAYGAAVSGLRVALERLNTANPAVADTACPPLPDGSAAPLSGGVCGPYESSDQPGATVGGARYRYWITTVMTANGCTGSPPADTSARSLTFQERCITAVGETLAGGSPSEVLATRRVQSRVAATTGLVQPIPGIWGTECVTINPNGNFAGSETCATQTAGASSSAYYGTVGSNGTIRASVGSWLEDPLTSPVAGGPCAAVGVACPAVLYLGTDAPDSTATTRASAYEIKTAGPGAQPGYPSACPAGSLAAGNTFKNPCLPFYDQGNRPHYFGFYFHLPRASAEFALPPKPVFPAYMSACTTNCDTATTNDNAVLGNAALGQAPPAAGGASYTCPGSPYTPSGSNVVRRLAIGAGCTLYIPNGTYDFCTIDMAAGAHIIPALRTTAGSAVPAAKGEVRIFLDNSTRGGSGCPSAAGARSGKLTWPSNPGASAVPTWMTNATSANDCSALNSDPWTALAGQLFVYGAAEAASGVQPYNSALDFPAGKFLFNGVLQAPNSTLNVNGQSSCIRGGLAAGALNIAQNLSFVWDNSVDLIVTHENKTYYRTAFSQCTPVAGANPMAGC